jgi:hypothetical protein
MERGRSGWEKITTEGVGRKIKDTKARRMEIKHCCIDIDIIDVFNYNDEHLKIYRDGEGKYHAKRSC